MDPSREKISLVIQADGTVLLNNDSVSRQTLGLSIRKLVETGVKRAEIRGDQLSDYGLFVEVMEKAREQGIESIGIVKKREEPDDRR